MPCSGPRAISSGSGGCDPRGGRLVLTFDNLGEASELERGTWPSDAPLGEHRSVTEALPRLLDELDARELTATFFVEAINCELYPDAVREIASRGHELGMHGWRHEMWAGLSRGRERETVARAMGAYEALGFEPRGFRPPGGDLTAASLGLLRDAGVTWCSPAGGTFGVRDGLTWVPFDWELVDAYHLMERFSRLRAIRGDAFEPPSAGQLAPRMSSGLRVVAESGGRGTLILHPFLMLDAEWWRGVRELLSEIAALSRDRGLWVGPGGALTADPRAL